MSAKREFIRKWMQAEEADKAASDRRSAEPAGDMRPTGAPVPSSRPRREFQGPPPPLVPFADMDFWYLTRPLTWTSASTTPSSVVVPAGFTTDFASIPSLFWSSLPSTGLYGFPAVVHDWLYWEQAVTRDAADTLFDAALGDLNVPMWKRTIIYRSVWWFGGSYWDDNTVAKAKGRGRVLKQFPEDMHITWAEWQTRPGAFV